MTLTKWAWLILVSLYVAFFSWYTSFEGPLTDKEMAHYLALFAELNPDATHEETANLRKFMEDDTGDDFVMINIIDMYDRPLEIEGVHPDESSEDVMAKYMEYMFPAMLSRASHPVFMGPNVASRPMDIMNADGMEVWDRAGGVRYRSRRDLLDIATNPAFQGRHEFKVAAMAKTIAFPLDPFSYLGDPRLVLALLFGLIGCAIGWIAAARHSRSS